MASVIVVDTLRVLLSRARDELGYAKDLATGSTQWVGNEGQKHWTSGEGAALLNEIDNVLGNKEQPVEFSSIWPVCEGFNTFCAMWPICDHVWL